jgi:hypothetical protein
MRYVSGDSHLARLYAKISDGLTLGDVDRNLLSGLPETFKPMGDREKAQRTLTLQILFESLDPDSYECMKRKGGFDRDPLTGSVMAMSSGFHSMPKGCGIKGADTKIYAGFGSLAKGECGYYIAAGSGADAGFMVEMYNNEQADVGKKDCEDFIDAVAKVISKYPGKLEVVGRFSV